MKALVIDMSEVIIRTASINIIAWERVFNDYFELNQYDQTFTREDYYSWFEGKTKYERVKNFLNSRNINIQYGDFNDPAGFKTIYGIEKKKSKRFNRLLREGHLEVYEAAVRQIRLWKESGLKTAIVSSDENFKKALKLSDLKDLFDVKIDGHASRKLGLKEKPEADLYIEATKELGVEPESCILFDDTPAGLQAGSKANFGLVVGVNRRNNRKLLSENGADIIIDGFDDLNLLEDPEIKMWFTQPAAPFASEYVQVMTEIGQKTPVLFLDYDGTLTPIVNNPDEAVISEEMRTVLKECAAKFKVAAISGRDMDDLKQRIKLGTLIYAGSHGFRISGPDNLYHEHEKTKEILPILDKTEASLTDEMMDRIPGLQVERKRYAIAIHYRNASPDDLPEIKEKVDNAISGVANLKVDEGKKIFEIKPAFDWNKGKAVDWILEKLELTDRDKYLPIYIGDDKTDEDAYKSLKGWGIGIQVGPGAENSAARFRLKNVYQVRILLHELAHSMDKA